MEHVKSIKERLNNCKMSHLERYQREFFINFLNSTNFPDNAKALSVSCGDGIWDYLVLKNSNLKEVVATDIVDCPVKKEEQDFFKEFGLWKFEKIKAEQRYPFVDQNFDFIFHQDVIEHVQKPFLFLQEQFRVLKSGGKILIGTPNLLRPANVLKIFFGNLKFPMKIGENFEIGQYIHIQEFTDNSLKIMMEEVGFVNVEVFYIFWGIHILNKMFSAYPKGAIGKQMAHFLYFSGEKL